MIQTSEHRDGGQVSYTEAWDTSTSIYTSTDAHGVVTVTRPFTADETAFYTQQVQLAAAAQAAAAIAEPNRVSITAKASAAIAANITYLGIATPSAAQVSAQVALLTRENTAIIRLLLGKLDDTAGT